MGYQLKEVEDKNSSTTNDDRAKSIGRLPENCRRELKELVKKFTPIPSDELTLNMVSSFAYLVLKSIDLSGVELKEEAFKGLLENQIEGEGYYTYTEEDIPFPESTLEEISG